MQWNPDSNNLLRTWMNIRRLQYLYRAPVGNSNPVTSLLITHSDIMIKMHCDNAGMETVEIQEISGKIMLLLYTEIQSNSCKTSKINKIWKIWDCSGITLARIYQGFWVGIPDHHIQDQKESPTSSFPLHTSCKKPWESCQSEAHLEEKVVHIWTPYID